MKCDRCNAEATFTVTAAYPACDDVHPHFATYPQPLARVCSQHVAMAINIDSEHPGATPAYLVRQR